MQTPFRQHAIRPGQIAIAFVLALTAEFALPCTQAQETAPAPSTTASAATLRSVFSPSRAPEQKTMGLLQRSFLDLAEQDGALLQMAIVVDGTDSMTSELAGVRESINAMIEDLKRYRGDEVEVALVIYRDHNSPSGEVSIPLKSFSRDTAAIAAAVAQISPESGAPFFNELADVGLHATLSELPWSSDPSTSRWIMMFGDAPPYEESFNNPEFPTARRRYSTELLVAIAARKSIRVNCILCTSDKVVMEPYDKAIDQTRTFMNSLASGTDGLMLDLSYPEIRDAIIDAGRKPEPEYVAIDPITRGDLNTMSITAVSPDGNASDRTTAEDIAGITKPAATDAPATRREDVRIAVLPHLPLDQMSFDPSQPAVQVSTILRNNFASVPGVRVVSPIDIQKQLRRMKADDVDDSQLLRALAARLGVDYVIWGALEPVDATVQTAAYRRTDGNRVVQVSLKGDEGSLTRVLLTAAATSPDEKDGALGGLMKRIEESALSSVLDQPLASSDLTRKEVLTGMEALEQAMGLPAASKESLALLQKASTSLAAAAASEPRNPLIQWLQSNIAYNVASHYYASGDVAVAEQQMKEMGSALARAYRGRREVNVKSLSTEIEADYMLLVARNVPAAVAGYQDMIAPTQPSSTQRRGHWMLSGIFAGDWGVDESNVNPKAARDHIVAILGNWPESPEAELLRRWMRWDDSAGKTKFSFLPIVNRQLAKIVPADEVKPE